MGINRGILGSKRSASSTYGQVIEKSKEVLGSVLKEKNEQQMEYVLSVAALKAQGKDLSVTKLKELFNKVTLEEGVFLKKIRLINFYLNNLSPEGAKRFIEKFEKKETINKNAT